MGNKPYKPIYECKAIYDYKPLCLRVEFKEPKMIDNVPHISHGYLDYNRFRVDEIDGIKFFVVERSFSNKREDVYLRFDEIDNFSVTYQRGD